MGPNSKYFITKKSVLSGPNSKREGLQNSQKMKWTKIPKMALRRDPIVEGGTKRSIKKDQNC